MLVAGVVTGILYRLAECRQLRAEMAAEETAGLHDTVMEPQPISLSPQVEWQTPVEVAAVLLLLIRQPVLALVVPGLSSSVMQALNEALAAPLLPLAVSPITRLTHRGLLQHESLCTNRRKQRRPASAGY
jgi:hypothetical protein